MIAAIYARKSTAQDSEVSEGVLLDYDSVGNPLGIDIDNASATR